MQLVMSRQRYEVIHSRMRIADRDNFEIVFERVKANIFNILC
jgi:hypothetical protein